LAVRSRAKRGDDPQRGGTIATGTRLTDRSRQISDAELEDLLEANRERNRERLGRRERVGEIAAGGSFLAVATLMAALLPWDRDLSALPAIGLTLAYALASRIKFEFGTGFTVPTQLIFVPMLFLLPTPAAPLFVALGNLLGEAPDYVRGARHPERAVMALGDAWHAVGPAAVLVAAGATDPALADWPIYLLALAAQFGFDFTASALREGFELGLPAASSLRDQMWVSAVDALLSPIGLLVVLGESEGQLYQLLVLVAVIGLLAILARERRARLQGTLDLRSAYQGTTSLLADLIEHDDKYTGAHSRGIASLALRVADELSVGGRRRRITQFAALLHDVGKISVSPAIINKRGPLTDAEWAEIRRHTLEGERMLCQVGGLLAEVGRVVRYSHERWDGRGYPDGLRGEQIPLEARIVSCCDAFHAMTTTRPYRGAMSVSEALREIRSCAGTQFDPEIARVMRGAVIRAGRHERTASPGGGRGEPAISPPTAFAS
jgi:HD-GYP domain-containing protein (c-di-GMP phosphodiesterase class II)